MDEIDLKLFKLISENPRCSYRDMSDALGISTPAVHRRIQTAREQHILYGPTAMLNSNFAKGVGLVMWGKSDASSLDEINKAIEGDDCTQIVTMMGGSVLLVRALLKDLKDMDSYVNMIRGAAKMTDLTIGISPYGINKSKEFEEVKLGKVDFKIMSALSKDGRMSVSDISEMMKISPKTVRNHLKKILDNRIIELMTIINHSSSGNFATMLVLNLEPGSDKHKIMTHMKNNFSPTLVETYAFSNQLDMVVTYASVEDMAQLVTLCNKLNEMDGVTKIDSNVFIQSCGNCNVWPETIIADPEKCMEFLKNKKII